MTKTFTIDDSLENKISFYLLAFFLAVLPFDRIYAELTLICFVLHTLFHINRQRARAIISPHNLVLYAVFFIGLIGLLWSGDKPQGIKDIQRQLAMILFPVALSATGLDLNRYKKSLLLIFGASCTIVIIYLYVDAIRIIAYNKMPLKSLFSPAFINHNFSDPIGIHATYMAMYIALSLAAFLHYVTIEKKQTTRWIYAAFIAIMLAGLVQLASRSVFITMAVFALVFPVFLTGRQKKIRWIIGVAGIAVIALVAVTQIDAFQKRYVATLKEDLSLTTFHNVQPESRAYRWEQALQLTYSSPVIGYGTGTEKKLLKERYFEKKLYRSYLQELNAHSQYISFLLKTGIIGLLVYLAALYMGFAAAWRSRDAVFSCFMLLIMIVGVSENILDVNKGVFFYAFFFSFFLPAGKPFGKLFRLVP
jgi:O-antigen ligase